MSRTLHGIDLDAAKAQRKRNAVFNPTLMSYWERHIKNDLGLGDIDAAAAKIPKLARVCKKNGLSSEDFDQYVAEICKSVCGEMGNIVNNKIRASLTVSNILEAAKNGQA